MRDALLSSSGEIASGGGKKSYEEIQASPPE
jgi:hypothetical protein